MKRSARMLIPLSVRPIKGLNFLKPQKKYWIFNLLESRPIWLKNIKQCLHARSTLRRPIKGFTGRAASAEATLGSGRYAQLPTICLHYFAEHAWMRILITDIEIFTMAEMFFWKLNPRQTPPSHLLAAFYSFSWSLMNSVKQARKPQSYVCLNLRPND